MTAQLALALALDDEHQALALADVVTLERFDLAPALELAGTLTRLARAAGVSHETAARWQARGIDWRRADRIAVALGRHPGELWPEWWEVDRDA